MNELGRKPARREESGLGSTLAGVARQRGKAPLANRRGARQLGLGQVLLELGLQGQVVLRELASDAQVAETRLAGMNTRLHESIAREEAVRLEPVEQRLDWLRRGGLAPAITVTLSRVGADVAQELSAQLEPALVALREQLQRARLQRPARLQRLSP